MRQPLQILEIPVHLPVEFANLIADEVNVKFVAKADKLSLDTTLTDELREEGIVRDAIREIQAFRKESNLRPGQHVTHRMRTQNRAVIEKNIDQVQKATNTTIEFE